jgi:pentatricopeptide repeat protein
MSHESGGEPRPSRLHAYPSNLQNEVCIHHSSLICIDKLSCHQRTFRSSAQSLSTVSVVSLEALIITMKVQQSPAFLVVSALVLCARSSLGFTFTSSATRSKSSTCTLPVSSSSSVILPVTPWGLSTSTGLYSSTRADNAINENENELELDEDEYDFDATRSFAAYQDDLIQLAQTTSQNPNAPAMASKIFDSMFEAFIMTEDSALWPNTTIYNLILEIHAYSADPDGAVQASQILTRMQDPDLASSSVARPNRETYAKVMEAWAKRKQPDKVAEVFQQMQTYAASTTNTNTNTGGSGGDHELTPDTFLYNRLIRAYGMAGVADQAAAVLAQMLADTSESIQPDYQTWVYTARAFATPKYKDTGVEQIRSLMEQMEQGRANANAANDGALPNNNDWLPRTEMYNALLRALSYRKGGAREAERILYEMIAQSRQAGGKEEMRPNAESFYNVIQAYRRVSDSGVAVKVEKLLELQGALKDGNGNPLKVTARTYNAAMAAMSRARDPKKAVRSKQVLDKMKVQYNLGDDSFAPSVYTYRTLLNSCAYTDGEPVDKLAAFQIAVDVLKELRESDYLDPDSNAYSLFLRACANLMPASRKRDAVIENVFLKCTKDGFLSDNALAEFENAASEELQLKIIGGFLEDGVQPPAEWSRNVVSYSK